MPSKKKKYNARFPPARIKKIMQTDDEVGKVAAAVPVIISRALELFVESLITKANEFTQLRNAKTLSTLHLKQCILSENKFDFLKDLVVSIPDVQIEDDTSNSSLTSPAVVTAPVAHELVKGNQPKTRQKRRRRKLKEDDLDDNAGPSNSGAEESENSEEDESDADEEDEEDEKRYCTDPQIESARSTNSVYPTSSFQVNMMRTTTGVASTTNPDDEDYDS